MSDRNLLCFFSLVIFVDGKITRELRSLVIFAINKDHSGEKTQ